MEEIHRGRKKGLTDANMPSWDTLFPHDKEGVGQGFFIEADVHVPDDRHEYLQGLPPAPAHTKIGVDDLPPHIQLLVRERYGEKYSGGKSEKLIASLLDKEDLVMHHSTAELYARLGVRITVKKVLGFIESSVMNAWVEKATAGRIKAALEGDVLMVSLYKLIINAVVCTYILIYIHTYVSFLFQFGKTIEGIEGHLDSHIIKDVEDQLRILSSPFLKSFAIIDDETMIATLVKKDVELDRPVSIGTAILGEPSFLYSCVIHLFLFFRTFQSRHVFILI